MRERGVKNLPKALMVVGPTASGKTDLAIALAKELRGEIISIDSRQMYRGLEIGADIIPGRFIRRQGRHLYVAKGIPHHLIAIRKPDAPLSAAEVKVLAIQAAHDAVGRGRLPIFAGGTGLYADMIARNFTVPEVPPNAAMRSRLAKRPLSSLYKELLKKDPVYASRISPLNRRYVTRALEVIAATGRAFSAQQGEGEPIFDILKIGIQRPRAQTYERIDRRVDRMMADGLLREARRLGKKYGWSLSSLSGLGHRQLGLYLEKKISLEEAVRLIKRDTRRFAKRQMTWFRRDKAIKWVKNERDAKKIVKAFLSV